MRTYRAGAQLDGGANVVVAFRESENLKSWCMRLYACSHIHVVSGARGGEILSALCSFKLSRHAYFYP